MLWIISPHFNDILKEVKDFQYTGKSEIKIVLSPIINIINQPEFIKYMLNINHHKSWYVVLQPFFITRIIFKQITIENYRSLGISDDFISQLLLYPSGRPITDITSYFPFYNVHIKYLNLSDIDRIVPHYDNPYYISNIDDGIYNNIFIPIIRYQIGMHGYLTIISDTETEFCGTFYYYEPASNFMLFAPQILVSWNKITTCLDLGISIQTIFDILWPQVYNRITLDKNDNELDALPSIIGYNVDPMGSKEQQWMDVIKLYKDRQVNPIIHVPDTYAIEDEFDQLLCTTAHNMGISIIILKYMTGETRVVTEILDTRNRKQSFENIYIALS